MDEFDPTGLVRRFVSEAEYRLLQLCAELPAAAMHDLRHRAAKEMRQATITATQRAQAMIAILSRVPHNVAEAILSGFLTPATTRRLTQGEALRTREAFGHRAVPLAAKAVVSYGAARNPIAMAAFLNGNPAITIGNSLFFRPSYWKPDFAAPQGDPPLFLHEFTHVVQWDRMGHVVFLRRYLREKRSAGTADAMYDYRRRRTDFGHEMLEGQAQMVEDYTRYRRRIPPGQEAQAADLRRRLAGSGVYGL